MTLLVGSSDLEIDSEMSCNVSSGTVNSTIPNTVDYIFLFTF